MNTELSSAGRVLSIDELDRNIVSLSLLMNSCCYELLLLIREFDERLGWPKVADYCMHADQVVRSD